jgi:hypothetical protein
LWATASEVTLAMRSSKVVFGGEIAKVHQLGDVRTDFCFSIWLSLCSFPGFPFSLEALSPPQRFKA